MSTWSRPPAGVFKVNVFGYSSETMTFSTIGCVMRNINGYCIGGYYGKIGYETDVKCELRSILYGVKLGHDEGRRNIQVESCSEIAINHILNPHAGFEGIDLVNEIRGFMNTFDSCILQCVPESSNQLAISAAMYGLDEGNPVRYINSCPSDLISIMAEDWLSSL